jgi:hypothetical protein
MLDRNYTEKRDFIRMVFDAEISYKTKDNNSVYKGICKNLSHTGLQFETELFLPEGSELEVTIDSRNGKFNPLKANFKSLRVKTLQNNKYLVSGRISKIK